jgi:hypothetical protein
MSSEGDQPKETKAPLSVLYVKRKRAEPSNPSLFVQLDAKRQKVFNEFKFVTSTNTEPQKLDRDDLYKKYKHGNTVSDIKEKCRKDQLSARKNNKYNLISSLRTDSGALFSAEVQEQNEEDILCNAERMLSEKLSLNEAPPSFVSNGAEEWVYDVYLCENSCHGNIDAIHSEELDREFDFEPVEKQRYLNEYDEDSNDENFYANDYPDEESSSDNSGRDSDDSDGVVGKMRCSNEFFDSEYFGVNRSHYLDKYLCSDTDSD